MLALRRVLALLCALALGLPQVAAQGFNPGRPGFGFRSGFQFSVSAGFPAQGAVLDYDFARNRYSGPAISVARNSPATIDDLSGNWREVVANVLRRSDKGTLVEESRTNALLTSTTAGGGAGVRPNNWGGATNIQGLVATILGVGVDSGIEYVDVRLAGTTNNTFSGANLISFSNSTTVAATQGQTHTGSAFISLLSGDPTVLSAMNLRFSERDSAGGSLAQSDTNLRGTLTSGPLGQRRFTVTRTLNNASAAYLLLFISVSGDAAGVAVDFTFRVGWPQVEQGAFATSPMRSTNAAVTRAADVVTAGVSGVSGSATIALLGNPAGDNASGNQGYAAVSDGTSNERVNIYRVSGGGIRSSANSTTGNPPTLNQGSAAVGTRFAVAAAFAPGDRAHSMNGAVPVTETTAGGYPTSTTQLNVGSFPNGGSQANAYVERVAVFPSRRSNADLQALSLVQTWTASLLAPANDDRRLAVLTRPLRYVA